MNKLEQRFAIAESVGTMCAKWADMLQNVSTEFLDDNIPNYLNDLNAMHEVERRLTLDQRHIYYQRLWHICDKVHRMASVGEWLVPTASAAQRAEAYLRTIGKWKD